VNWKTEITESIKGKQEKYEESLRDLKDCKKSSLFVSLESCKVRKTRIKLKNYSTRQHLKSSSISQHT
jgi:hypothetical protein